MQYLLIAYDSKDDQALERRLQAREQHIKLGDKLTEAGQMLFGTAIMDDHDKMIGSMLVLDFPTQDELNEWLEIEPYVVGNVWQQIEIQPCRVGPSFAGLHR